MTMWKWIICGVFGALGMVIGELAPTLGEKIGGKIDDKKQAIPEDIEEEDDEEEEED